MKEHIAEYLIRKGYKTYSLIYKSNWNPLVKKQAQNILDNAKNPIFKKGDKNSDESIFYVETGFNTIYHKANYNVNNVGGTETHFVKSEDFDNEILYGLHEQGKPPTLIHPRPFIKVKRTIDYKNEKCTLTENEYLDDSMNLCLQKENPEEIFKAMFDKTIIFKYDLTKNKQQKQV